MGDEIFGVAFWLAVLLGAMLGSFIHAAAWRSVRERDWVARPSQCFACARRLSVLENMPIFGWLRRGGRCACGKKSIPPRYVLSELACALLAALIFWRLGAVEAAVFAPFFVLGAIIFLTDLEAFHIPDWASLGGLACGLALAASGARGLPDFTDSLLGCVSGFALIYGINALYKTLRGIDGIGLGDAKLMAMFGAWLGALALLPILFAASLAGTLVGIVLIGSQKLKSDNDAPLRLPFGCFLVPMAMVVKLFGSI